MDKFQYIMRKKSFKSATTIKAKTRIFNEVLHMDTSPYSYLLGKELKALMRPQDILSRHTNILYNQKNILQSQVSKALLTQEEIDLVFNNEPIQLGYISAESAVKICNKTPNLRCNTYINSSYTSSLLNELEYSQRGTVELVMLRDSIQDYQTNKLYKQLVADVVDYDKAVEPLLQVIKALEPLKNPTGELT